MSVSVRRPALLVFLLGAALILPVLRGQESRKGTRYALLVGCSDYKRTELRPLPYTAEDIEGFRKALLATGFEEDNIVVLHDQMPQTRYRPEKKNILHELEALIDGMRPEDTLVVALSGHGVHFKGEPTGYFCPVDTELARKATMIPMEGKGGLFDTLKACKARKKLLIVNACRNDPQADLAFSANQMPLDDEEPEEVPEGIAAIYSCKPGQKSYYDPNRKISFFYDHLIRAWKGEYSPDVESLTLEDVLNRVIDKTRIDVNRTLQVKQVPVVRREFKGDWVIARRRAAAPPSAANPAPAADESELLARLRLAPASTYALVVGIDRAGAGVKARPNAEADAAALHELLRAKEYLGVPADHVKLLLGTPAAHAGAGSARRADVLEALAWLEKHTTKKDQVIVAVFGSGAPAGGEYCVFAADSTFAGRSADALCDSDLEARLRAIACKRLVLFLDVDYLGFTPGAGPAPAGNTAQLYRPFMVAEERVGKRSLFASCNGITAPLADNGRSLFARVLLDGLRGGADGDGAQADGFVSSEELRGFLQEQFAAQAQRVGSDALERKQTSVWYRNHYSEFALTMNPARHAAAVARAVAFDKAARAGGLADEVREEGLTLLTLAPRLEAKRALRRQYEEFAAGRLSAPALTAKRTEILDRSRLRPEQAAPLARTVVAAYKQVQPTWVYQPTLGDFTAVAVAHLFRVADEPLPLDLDRRLKTKLTDEQAEALLTEARALLGKREDLADGHDLTLALNGALQHFDARASYIDPAQAVQQKNNTAGTFAGLGVRIRYDRARDGILVTTPILHSPAQKVGLHEGDLIREIIRTVDADGTPLPAPEPHPTRGMTTGEAVKLIVGKPGSKVRLVVERAGVDRPLEFDVPRGTVATESVHGHRRTADGTWDFWLDRAGRIAYMRISVITSTTPRDLKKAMEAIERDGPPRGLVLDLRFNEGGLLTQTIQAAAMFVEAGKTIVTVRPRQGKEISYPGKVDQTYTGFPLVCLINASTASGAELVAASIQDHGRGAVAGQRSMGNGTVRNTFTLTNQGTVFVTTGTLWRPSGKNLDKDATRAREKDEWGIQPDAGLEIVLDARETSQLREYFDVVDTIFPPDRIAQPLLQSFTDRQLQAALQHLRARIEKGQ